MVAVNTVGGLTSENVVFNNIAVEHLITTGSLVVATVGNQVHLAAKDTIGSDTVLTGQVDLAPGEDIISIIAHGETIFASTNNKRLYKVLPGSLPLNDFLLNVSTIIDGASDVMEHLTTSGDYLFFVVGHDVHRLNLNSYEDVVVTLDDTLNISSLVYSHGQVWVADQSSTTSRVRSIDLTTWTLNAETYDAQAPVLDLAFNNDLLVLAQGDFGIQIIEVSPQMMTATPALLSPTAGKVYVQGNTIDLSLTDITNERLNNLRGIDAFIQVACPRISTDNQFDKPVLSTPQANALLKVLRKESIDEYLEIPHWL